MPYHDGDGYSWGGDIIVSFGFRSINLGNSTHSGETMKLAHLIAAAPDLLEALKIAQLWLDVDGRYDMQGINAAIAKAEGRS